MLDRGVLPDSFCSDADEIIGSKLKVIYPSEVEDLKITVNREVNGRIFGRRYDAKIDRWEHLFAFKNDDEESALWLCLREHPCYIGSDIMWTRNLQNQPKGHEKKSEKYYEPMLRLPAFGSRSLMWHGFRVL